MSVKQKYRSAMQKFLLAKYRSLSGLDAMIAVPRLK